MHHSKHYSPQDLREMTSSKKEQTTLFIFLDSPDLMEVSSPLCLSFADLGSERISDQGGKSATGRSLERKL